MGDAGNTDTARNFLDKSRYLLRRDYLPKIDRCLDLLPEEDVWWRANDGCNSIGNLILHLAGNVTMWIIGGVGGRPYERNRQLEFDRREPVASGELRRLLRRVTDEADEVLAAVEPGELLDRRHIQGYHVTVLEAIYHVVEHFSMHTGQIILLAKARVGRDIHLWVPPSA